MALREKTIQKFKDYLEKETLKNQGREVELSFSQLQRETGSASGTMKRALEALQAEGWLEMKPGRNSRYGIFRIINMGHGEVVDNKDEVSNKDDKNSATPSEEFTPDEDRIQKNELPADGLKERVQELEKIVEGLRKRARTQEMTIALLQDRVAEIEDKLYKK